MACNFEIPFSGSVEEVIQKARTSILSQGGTFEGDSSSGRFQVSVFGTIAGTYTITGQTLSIRIDSKPLFISCNQIESVLSKSIG
jgi:hypothetical protein